MGAFDVTARHGGVSGEQRSHSELLQWSVTLTNMATKKPGKAGGERGGMKICG